MLASVYVSCLFFFQAEDGIRDLTVTGVQTCALPIWNTPDARRVRALALARYADMVPEPLAVRARAEAARAFLGAGDRVAARRVLAQVAADSTAPPDAQALAQSALVEALIDDGQLSEAANRLRAGSRLSEDDRAALRLKLARARIQGRELDLADSVLLADSSVDALALRGWV